jgi:hypothetical protein
MPSGIQDAFVRWDKEVTAPFAKLSRSVYPRTIRETFAWSEELWLHHGMYSQSIQAAVRYFMTELEISGDDLSFQSRKNYLQQISKIFNILEDLAVIGDDYMSFGNSFTSVYRPFVRSLVCRFCGFRAPLKQMKNYFRFQDGKFVGQCPNPSCGRSGEFERVDAPAPKEGWKPVITRWPPQFMMIKQHPLSKRTIYSVDLSLYDEMTSGVKQGDLLWLEDTPWEIVDAIVRNEQFEFAENEIFHMCHPPPASSLPVLKGWGLPPFMADFETAVLVTMLDKYIETIVVEYLMPFRVLSPEARTGEQDVMMNLNMGDFVGQIMDMLRRHRRNPTDWNFIPYALNYQVLGGEAANLIPVEILEHFEKRLLLSMGIPPEFHTRSLGGPASSTSPIIGFKMFERGWQHFANELNKWSTWACNKIGDMMSWEAIYAKLKPVSMYEDPEIRAVKLELAAAKEISRETAYAPLGIDAESEQEKIMDEEEAAAEQAEERQKRLEKRMANSEVANVPSPGQVMLEQQAPPQGAPGAGGMPPVAPGSPAGAPSPMGGGTGVGASIDDMLVQADQIATQLLVADPLTRRRQLSALKNQNEALHAQVKSTLKQKEQQGQTAGLQMARQGQIPVQ